MEAITRKKEVDEMKTLAKPFQRSVASLSGGLWSVTGGNSKVLIQSPGFVTYYQQTYFDLAGMTIDDKTLFFKAIQMQRTFTPEFTAGATGDSLMEMILLTQHPIAEADLLAKFVDPLDQLTFEEIVYCEARVYAKTIDEGNLAFPMLVHNNVASGARATASDRVYCYHIMSLSAVTPGSGVSSGVVPTVMMIIGADAKEEPDFQYLMRLKRSYDLQNEPDRD